MEVFSGGKNVGPRGKARQSSTNGNGLAERALDGNKDPDWKKNGQTHTSNSGSKNPWWEVDLGQPTVVQKISIWNRQGFESRLDGFTLLLLDSDRKELVRLEKIAAPQWMEIDLEQGGKQSYFTYAGQAGTPVPSAKAGTAKSEPKKVPEPTPEANLSPVPSDYRDPAPFAFQKGDVVAILGNGLPDRMQHDGWFETLLQSELKGKEVRFRNMSASGDRPDSFPRSKGAISMTEYLQHVKADVVFAFFGYNESFDGIEKAGQHQRKLVEFIQRTRGSKANGKSFPRIVLFSPIAHEDTRNPNVPDGKAHNLALEAYTKATQAAAEEPVSALWIFSTRRRHCFKLPAAR